MYMYVVGQFEEFGGKKALRFLAEIEHCKTAPNFACWFV